MMDIKELANKRIRIVSAHNSDLSIVYPELRLNRSLVGEGSSITLAGDVVSELLSDQGFKYMLEQGMIIIENKEDRIDLGLEEEGIKVVPTYKRKELIAFLKEMPYPGFVTLIAGFTNEQRRGLAEIAIEEEITELTKIDLLKKYTSIDILKAIMLNREVAAAEAKKAAEKAAGMPVGTLPGLR